METVKVTRKDLLLSPENKEIDSLDDVSALLSQRLSNVFEFSIASEEVQSDEVFEDTYPNDDQATFNLFSDVNTVVTKVTEPSIKNSRPLNYYILEDSPERQRQLQASVFTYDQLMKAKEEKWPACQKLHKVVSIKKEESKHRRRPSKKRRIRMKLLREKEEQLKRQAMAAKRNRFRKNVRKLPNKKKH
ncbi:DUF2011 family conserved fungal protein, implicated in fatty acid biosynthesis [Schizosaccharomyces pombe]|uniref:Uncharacterized nucleolar protein C630.06c n=1 Tax=Schizosaccharomyces pombe (strain 972 / ATCC 24843) TaxID=284812 RepID=YKI6_SCHPO|nr:uncharacterized protein SPAC630.06c [Schizosaccharomyces pombe]Q9UUH6.1 RecName: Full=Uncharacterized nucleolar protein C630.06c [Schizosaccharomyces pombe 972h-]CAB52728.1 conserved fungal protein [Schizosaccharomyces pombe]|eukprot:NP_592901.1 uncharacterized protein SPAC630.06c [Schizosaccharomyces pombe]